MAPTEQPQRITRTILVQLATGVVFNEQGPVSGQNLSTEFHVTMVIDPESPDPLNEYIRPALQAVEHRLLQDWNAKPTTRFMRG